MIDLELLGHNLLPYKENINLHVFSAIMKYWIVSNRHNSLIVTKKNKSSKGNLQLSEQRRNPG